MANPEHVRILQQGSDAWNRWRDDNQDIEPDLSGSHALAGLQWHQLNLALTDLTCADLADAHFHSSYFQSARLCGAKVRGAFMNLANLHGVDASGADFSEARLAYTYFGPAKARGA